MKIINLKCQLIPATIGLSYFNRVAMHSESNKMSANALSVIFAPVVLGTNKKLQAQDAIAEVPQQMM